MVLGTNVVARLEHRVGHRFSRIERVEGRRILADLAVTDGARLLEDRDTIEQCWIASGFSYAFGERLDAER